MKLFKNILFLTSFLLLAQACSDDYLAVDPTDLTNDDEFLSSPAKAQEALNGAYDALAYDNFLAGHAQFLSDIMADQINGTELTNSDWKAHYTWTTDIFLGTTFGLMQDGYKASGRANYLLDNLDRVKGLTEEDRKRMTAEAKFIRAITYFELVRLFAQPYGFSSDNSHLGIVARTSSLIEPQGRKTVKEVYELIISDLTDAANNLPTSNGVYATKWSAEGYLAKVYFQMNDHENAYAKANNVLANGGFVLDTSIHARYRPALLSTELVFALQGTDAENDNPGKTLRNVYRIDAGSGRASVYISDAQQAATAINTSDKRLTEWYLTTPTPRVVHQLIKFPQTTADGVVIVPLVSVSELKLVRSESGATTGKDLTLCAQDVKDIMSRAGIVPNVLTEATNIITNARAQRQIEFVGEGNRLHELKRIAVCCDNGLKVRGVAPWNCPGLVCQYPAGELQAGSIIKPNPTGGCQ